MGVLDQFRVDGQVALVTGVGRGIGQAMAVALAEYGANIAGLYNTRYEETQQMVSDLGKRFLPVQTDLETARTDDLSNVIDQVIDAFGRLDILINNAGIIRRTPAIEYSETDWDAVLQVDLKSVFFLSQAAARAMAERKKGKIIHIVSLLAFQGGITVPSYAAAKHGMVGLTKAMANEWATLGINVNAIAPGYIKTDNTAALQADPVRYPAILKRIPAGRWGNPDDLKSATVFLASEASNYVHGTVITVDGGWMGR